ncbi:ATP-dependent DNA ligase [Nocardioides guangzhouensis]|uniref:DNA ligase B n=1 Tax=Nocardioides guangzhouensis TaxID=2497878 RepID=A0A4Q4ZGV2_9ACTN|nr:ATP-dependent DNA ligase [Nocardioides guangzhouensis]RYP87048.1 ATP-dependent DNA ligase [Nocardioides guangzhouensis]
MLLAEVVDASSRVAATRSRLAKVEVLAEVLGRAAPEELEVATTYLSGTLRQRRTGLGWRSTRKAPAAADEPSLGILEVDAVFGGLAELSGPGSKTVREATAADLFGRATLAEQRWLVGAITGNVRQGASDALVQEAVAKLTGLPLAAIRSAAMLAGSTRAIVGTAVAEGEPGLAAVRLEVGRPVLPMLAASEPDAEAAWKRLGATEVSVDWKLDGIRLQAHKVGDRVLLATRTLEDITARLPEVVEVVRALPAERAVVDGEALAIGPDGRPRPFQETSSRTASATGVAITPYFFDLLHVDGEDLLDRPARDRSERLAALVPDEHLVPRSVVDGPDGIRAVFDAAVAAGHEGVVVKSLDATYDAGRRGVGWVKVKPVHTLDLVVLAVEEGSGRRRGWLSNIHLGARDPESGGFVMLGKTFKGMTDEMLAWQTERFTELMTERDDWVVRVRPEQVVEVAFDGLQRSTRYPGGLALRFARVVRYRDDKTADEADTIGDVRAFLHSD